MLIRKVCGAGQRVNIFFSPVNTSLRSRIGGLWGCGRAILNYSVVQLHACMNEYKETRK